MEANELKSKILSANKAYRSGNPVMSDQQFDDLVESLQKQIPEDEFNAFRDSLHEVKGKIKHPFIMGSLDKLKYEEPEEVKKFIRENLKTCLNVSAKIDGISCRCHYEDGKLVSASTRGDGTFGEDLTDKIEFVKGIHKTINSTKATLDIRGELVIFKDEFEKMTGFANARNAVAGIMGRKDWNPEDVRHVTFVPYTILGSDFSKRQQFDFLRDEAFCYAPNWSFPKSAIEEDGFIDKLFGIANSNYGYNVDGLVICDDSYRNEEKYRPDACKAFKINQLVAETKLIDVAFDGPSKNGLHVPVGILEPVELGGAVISRVSLYNLDFIKEKGLKYGSVVKLVRSGDVIPKILSVVKNPEGAKDINLPEVCNCCGSKLVHDGVNLVCKNKKCEDQVVNQLVLFIKNLGVKSASNATLKNLRITSFERLVKFVPNKKYKSELKLAEELRDKMFSRSKDDLLSNMTCFDGIGETTIRKIIDFYASKKSYVDDYMLSCDPKGYALNTNMKLLWIQRHGLPDGVGEITLDKFRDGLEEAYNNVMLIVNDSKYVGQTAPLSDPEVARKQSNGQSVCFTGALNTMSRSEASKKAEEAGFEVKGGVSKGLTYLVTNTPNSGSSKNKKAQQLGTKVITEEEFLKLISDNTVEGSVDDL